MPRKVSRRISMDDIASAVGVSRNAVWLALSGKDGVSEQTRQDIFAMATKLGYKKSAYQKKDGPSSSTKSVGLIASEEVFRESVFFGPIIMHIQQQVASLDTTLLVHAVTAAEQEAGTLPSFVQDKSVEGVIIVSSLPQAFIRQVASVVPVVLVDHQHPLLPLDCVGTGNVQGSYVATNYLVELGHSSIGFLGSVPSAYSYRQRFEGYRYAMEDLGLTVNARWEYTSAEESFQSISEFIASCDELPSAFVCANDALAFHLVQVLQARGRRIPDDCSIVGFDNQYFAEISNPPLTTIKINLEYFGRRAVDRLFTRIASPTLPPETVEIIPSLEIRGSTTAFVEDALRTLHH